MENSKHTPGPWEVDYEGPCRLAIIAPNDVDGAMVAFTNLQNVDGDMDEANARLIAAAPDLLKAIKIARTWINLDYPLNQDDVDTVDAAIAKAEGK